MGRTARNPRPRSPKRRHPPHPENARRRDERIQARTTLVRVATALIAAKGLENVTVGEISRTAGLSRPLVYFYFPDLRTLFLEAAGAARSALLAHLTNGMQQAPCGLEAIVAMGRAYLDFHRQQPDAFALCLANTGIRPGSAPLTDAESRILDLERSLMEQVVSTVTRGQADGSVRNDAGDPRMVALHLWAFVQGLVQLSSQHHVTLERTFGIGRDPFLMAGLDTLKTALAHPQ